MSIEAAGTRARRLALGAATLLAAVVAPAAALERKPNRLVDEKSPYLLHREELERRRPFLKGVVPIRGRASAYVYVAYACELPTNDLETFKTILEGHRPKEK